LETKKGLRKEEKEEKKGEIQMSQRSVTRNFPLRQSTPPIDRRLVGKRERKRRFNEIKQVQNCRPSISTVTVSPYFISAEIRKKKKNNKNKW
jgi:hypothetical protein